MKCEGCGTLDATKVRMHKDYDVCDICEPSINQSKMSEFTGNRRIEKGYSQQLGMVVSEHNKEYIEKTKGIKISMKPPSEKQAEGREREKKNKSEATKKRKIAREQRKKEFIQKFT